LGDFVILRRIGRGGMGQVFLAEQTSLKRKVALKLLRPELSANSTALQRFRIEAEAVARISHANIVQVYAIGVQDAVHFMALEYVEGKNLRDYLDRKGPPDLPIALSIMRQIASALQRAAELGIVHRDIKPENILLTRKVEVKVADFGLSRCFTDGQPLNLTQSGVSMGTPLYMSPEQVQGKPVDHRTDIYSFGVTSYHLLTGQPPFHGATSYEVAIKHVQQEPIPIASIRPDLPAELCAIVHKMMAKKPDDRYQSAREILRDLALVRGGTTGAAKPPLELSIQSGVLAPMPITESGFVPPANRRTPRWLMIGGIVAACVVLIAIGAGLRVLQSRRVKPPVVVTEVTTPYVSAEERMAIELAERFADPKPEWLEIIKGVGFQIDLGMFYLKQGRIDEAGEFFNKLDEKPYRIPPQSPPKAEHPYRTLAKIGNAIVLANRDQPKESLEEFRKAVASRRPVIGGGAGDWLSMSPWNNVDLRKAIADALNRNAINLKQEKLTDSTLENLRHPPRAPELPSPIPKKTRPKDGATKRAPSSANMAA
jgi:serine/threonine-protein kinase